MHRKLNVLESNEGFWIHEGVKIQCQVLLLVYSVCLVQDVAQGDYQEFQMFTQEFIVFT